MNNPILLALAAAVFAIGVNLLLRHRRRPSPVAVGDLMQARLWEIGPVTPQGNYSVGMPLHPFPIDGGLAFDFPYPDKAAGHVHALAFRHGPLTGKTRLVVRFRVEAAAPLTDSNVRIVPTNSPASPSMLSLFFQRGGDDWSARGAFEAYRWYSPRRMMPITVDDCAYEQELAVGLAEDWTAVLTSSARSNPDAFHAAIADTDRVGIVFGGGDGLAHGVFATGPARFVLTGFTVE